MNIRIQGTGERAITDVSLQTVASSSQRCPVGAQSMPVPATKTAEYTTICPGDPEGGREQNKEELLQSLRTLFCQYSTLMQELLV